MSFFVGKFSLFLIMVSSSLHMSDVRDGFILSWFRYTKTFHMLPRCGWCTLSPDKTKQCEYGV